MADVDGLLRLYGLARYSVPGDGDCFLYSLTVVFLVPSLYKQEYEQNFRLLFPNGTEQHQQELHRLLVAYGQSGCLRQLRFEVEGHRAASRGGCLLMPA